MGATFSTSILPTQTFIRSLMDSHSLAPLRKILTIWSEAFVKAIKSWLSNPMANIIPIKGEFYLVKDEPSQPTVNHMELFSSLKVKSVGWKILSHQKWLFTINWIIFFSIGWRMLLHWKGSARVKIVRVSHEWFRFFRRLPRRHRFVWAHLTSSKKEKKKG